uniref:Non-specific lipid-transfer protein n=1 Tax=Nelumbo nucifera TaxID=4432 RepID=A0A822XXY2_NELNU|nr:TPA_asm: hypothetical protein HUJ06_026684 [Nelumbo nucifera]
MTPLPVFLVMLLLISGSSMAAAPSCMDVGLELAPCMTYLSDEASNPSKVCCRGVKSVAKQSKDKKDRLAICQCLKTFASTAASINSSRVAHLPHKCNVKINVPPISAHLNCSKSLSLDWATYYG